MFKSLKYFFLIPLLSLLFLSEKPAQAADFQFNGYTLAQDQNIEDDLYVYGEKADINGVVQGDLFVFSKEAVINGTISGDVYVFSMTATVAGNIYGDVFTMANQATISGNVKGNIYTFANASTFSGQAENDVLNISANASITGTIGDDLRIISSTNTIDSLIVGDLINISPETSVLSEKVSGNIYDSTTIKGIAKEQGVDFDAENTAVEEQSSTMNRISDVIIDILSKIFSLGLVGYIIVMLSPVKTYEITKKVTGSVMDFVKSFGLGLAICILLPFPIILLCISILGGPLALVVTGVMIFLLIFGKLWIELALGQEILTLFKVKGYRPFKSLLIGRTLTVLIGLIPVAGLIYSLVLSITSVGAVTRMKLAYWKKSKA